MVRKVLTTTALLLCVSFASFAQDMEAIKKSVSDSQEKLFSYFSNFEKEKNKKPPVDLDKVTGDQFFIPKDVEKKLLKKGFKKEDCFREVLKILKKQKSLDKKITGFSYSSFTDPLENRGKKKDKKIKDVDIYRRLTYRVQVRVLSSISGKEHVARYEVDLEWGVLLDKKNLELKTLSLISVEAKEISFIETEKSKMQNIAKNLITDYCKGFGKESDPLPNDPKFKKLLEKSIDIKVENINDIKCGAPSDGKKITATVESALITLSKAPVYDKDFLYLYSDTTQPAGDVFKSMTFVVKIDDDLQSGKIENVSTTYDREFLPKTDEELVAQIALANETAKDFVAKLKNYAASETKSKEAKEALINMFESDKKPVIISHSGNKKSVIRSAKEYFSRLKKSDIDVKLSKPEFSNIDRVKFQFEQRFQSETYCDITVKTLEMEYIDGRYLITAINVESTEACE